MLDDGPWWYTEGTQMCTFWYTKYTENAVQRSISMMILWFSRIFVYRVCRIADWCVPRIWLYSARISLQGHKVHVVHAFFLRGCGHMHMIAPLKHTRCPRPKSLKILLASNPSMSFTNSVVFWAIPPPYKDTHHDNGSDRRYNAR
jgi:hypothetical protein